LARGRGLPSRDVPVVYSGSYAPLQEALQPPLYYLLSALVTARVPGADDVEAALYRNPYFPFEAPNPWPDNKNLWLRSPSVGVLNPGFLLALRLARLVSTCLGAMAVVGAYGLGLTCFDGDREKACLAAAWVAFNPQFVHVSGLVSNDSTAAGLAALTLWITAMWAVHGPSLRKAIVWGIVLGLMALTKVNALGITPVCMLGFWMGTRGKRWGLGVKYAIGVAGMALLVAGWWYARGAFLYDDPLGLYPHLTRSIGTHEPFSISEQLARVLHIDWSYWAAFGSSVVQPPSWLLGIVVWWGRIGLLGAGVYVWRRWQTLGQKRWLIATLFACLLIYLLGMMGWLWAFPLPLGRLMFPAATVLSVLLVMGWEQWLPARWRRVGLRAMSAGLLAFAVISLPVFLRAAYDRPPQLSTKRVDALKEWPSVIFGDGARLLIGEVNPRPVHPGEWT